MGRRGRRADRVRPDRERRQRRRRQRRRRHRHRRPHRWARRVRRVAGEQPRDRAGHQRERHQEHHHDDDDAVCATDADRAWRHVAWHAPCPPACGAASGSRDVPHGGRRSTAQRPSSSRCDRQANRPRRAATRQQCRCQWRRSSSSCSGHTTTCPIPGSIRLWQAGQVVGLGRHAPPGSAAPRSRRGRGSDGVLGVRKGHLCLHAADREQPGESGRRSRSSARGSGRSRRR